MWRRDPIQSYFYTDALATSDYDNADIIFNGNGAKFCAKLGKTYVDQTDLGSHYHAGRQNGAFYSGWYYVGEQFCGGDTLIWGDGSPYSVWRYNKGCGCCIETGSWTLERKMMVRCQ